MKTESLVLAAAVLLLCLGRMPAGAADSFTPHYASVRGGEANLREGPSYANRVLWVYHRKNYPVKIIASFDTWRRVKDVDGTVGWMHHSQLSDMRSAVFIGFTKSAIHNDAAMTSKILAFAQPGVVARLKACKPDVCEVETSGVDGWVDRKNIWGVDAGEVFQ